MQAFCHEMTPHSLLEHVKAVLGKRVKTPKFGEIHCAFWHRPLLRCSLVCLPSRLGKTQVGERPRGGGDKWRRGNGVWLLLY